MEEKRIKALSDEELDKVTGGADGGDSGFVPCPNCHEYTFPKPGLGSYTLRCICGAIIDFQDGEVQSFTLLRKPSHPTAGDIIYEFDEYETPL